MNIETMTSLLDTIWRTGDRDECAIKHIGHAAAAIIVGKTWTDGLDYETSGFTDQQWNDIQESEAAAKNGDMLPCGRPSPWKGRDMYKEYLDENRVKLQQQWQPIVDWVEEAGTEAFYDLVMQTNYFAYINSYILMNLKHGATCPEWGELAEKSVGISTRKIRTFRKKE